MTSSNLQHKKINAHLNNKLKTDRLCMLFFAQCLKIKILKMPKTKYAYMYKHIVRMLMPSKNSIF